MITGFTRDELVARVVRAGKLQASGESPEEFASFFDTETFRFHAPGGVEGGFADLREYAQPLREAFDDRTLEHGYLIVEGNMIAFQTRYEATFARPLSHPAVGVLAPNGKRIVMEYIGMVRLDDQARIVEEFVQTDNATLMQQLTAS